MTRPRTKNPASPTTDQATRKPSRGLPIPPQHEIDQLIKPAKTEDLATLEKMREALSPMYQRRLKTLTIGAKLLILKELEAGLSFNAICRTHLITREMIPIIKNDPLVIEAHQDSFADKETKRLLAKRFYDFVDVALSHISPEKLEKLNAYQLIMAAAVALDKARLVEGESTQNVTIRSVALNLNNTLEQLRERKTQLEAVLKRKEIRADSVNGCIPSSTREALGLEAREPGDEQTAGGTDADDKPLENKTESGNNDEPVAE